MTAILSILALAGLSLIVQALCLGAGLLITRKTTKPEE